MPETNRSVEDIAKDLLQEKGWQVEKTRGVPRDQTVVLREIVEPGTTIKLGIVSDEHLCSRHQQLSSLKDFYRYADSKGVEAFISGGDSVDGGRMHRDQEFELFVHGASAQVNYAAANLPMSANGPTYRIDGNHDYCVEETTEALTNKGWLRYADIDGTESFATLNPTTLAFEWQKPVSLYQNANYEGDLIHWSARSVDSVVTPNHSMLVRPGRDTAPTFRRKRASVLPKAGQYWRGLRTSFGWNGIANDYVSIPGTKRLRNGSMDIPLELFIQLAGWYISEGSVDGNGLGNRITISQSGEKSQHYQAIVHLVRKLGFEPEERSSMVRFCNAPIAQFLKHQFGATSHKKSLPDWVKAWPAEVLKQLVLVMMDGDGHQDNPQHYTYTTASDKLVDDLSEVCLKIGWGSTVCERGISPVAHTKYIGSYRRVQISTSIDSVQPYLMKPTTEAYRGLVWCPQLDNGIWCARRNGKAIWTGNSHFNQSGHSFGAALEEKRPDMKFLGYAGATLKIGAATIYVMHGDGGCAYARTYKLQRIAEQLDLDQRGVDLFVLGHYHVSGHLPRYRGVNCIMAPCWQSQTPYLRRKGLMPDIGGLVIEIEFGQHGIREIRTDWRFYDVVENDY